MYERVKKLLMLWKDEQPAKEATLKNLQTVINAAKVEINLY